MSPLVVAGFVLGGAVAILSAADPVEPGMQLWASGPVFDDSDHATLVRATRAVRPRPPIPLGERVVQAALAKVGVPYVWGAKGPNTFDCSGLTGWAWRQFGVRLGPDTYTQVHQGHRVSDVLPGDLIFPLDSMGARGPGHVQLAISPTQVVEAPGRGMTVRVRAMPARYVAIRPDPSPG
jgi:cell wall-associated NlpC family hydrolase